MPPTRPTQSARLTTLIDKIKEKQAAYLIDNNEYWQGKRTKDDLDRKNSDHPSWRAVGLSIADLKENVSVHAYSGPRGKGFLIVAEIQVDEGVFSKTWVEGAEKERAHTWIFTSNEDAAT